MVELAPARRQHLADLIATRGFVRVADASLSLGVSDVTIRGDLAVLERDGAIVRVHGGAVPRGSIGERESPLESSSERDAGAKRAIGRAAAHAVSHGESVILDVGSTALAVATALVARRELHDVTVITNGLTIALALEAAIPRFTVIVTGGTLRPQQHSLVNPFGGLLLESVNADLAFIGCNGVDVERGVTNVNLPEADAKRAMMRAARRSVIVADASKLGRAEFGVVAPLAEFDSLITASVTGDAVDAARLDALRAAGLDVIVADHHDTARSAH